MKYLSRIILSCLLVALSGCTSTISTRIEEADSVAVVAGFQKKLVKGGNFVITTYQLISDTNQPYVFYIEGDGSITSGRVIADNPTPSKVMLLKLATMDHRPNVVYVARPCQFTPMELNPQCTQDYWVDKRFAEEAVDSINIVINTISKNQPVSLVGFSGGGGIAILVTARNSHVKDIITLAGNLDTENFSHHHKVYALKESLNPIDYATQIRHIPQLHLSGGQDKIVPSQIALAYVRASTSNCVKQKILPDITHTKGWDNIWKDVLQIPLTCGR